jgi:hypothetical protein
MKAQILEIDISGEMKIQTTPDAACELRINSFLEIKPLKRISLEAWRFQKLRALWYLLLKHLEKETGYSQEYWKKRLKSGAGYFVSVREPDGSVTRALRSVADGECNLRELSALFGYSFTALKCDGVIDLSAFEASYFEHTGRELVG